MHRRAKPHPPSGSSEVAGDKLDCDSMGPDAKGVWVELFEIRAKAGVPPC